MSSLLVAAIDFGTTYSGWAFSFKHEFERDPTKVAAKNWHGDQLMSSKAPTCVLIQPDGETFDSFGYKAESKYAELVADEKHEKWFFFKRFKMMLFDKIAGILKENLVLALEPEAASVFCRHLPVEATKGKQVSVASMKAGTKYMVLDAGGGTVDITFHQVIVDDKLREIHKASGGAWGGTRVDDEYEKFLVSIVGPDVMKIFKDQHMEDYIDMFRAFEIKKRDLTPDSTAKITISIPPSLYDLVLEKRGKHLKDIISEPRFKEKIKHVSGKLRVEPDVFKDLFRETITEIIRHTKSLLQDEKCQDCSTILMVGGFSESSILQGAVKNAFCGCRVIIPDGSSLVVLKGAVIFGHTPTSIEERVCRYTYGIKTDHRSSERTCKHPPTTTEVGKDGIMRCKDMFKSHVRCG